MVLLLARRLRGGGLDQGRQHVGAQDYSEDGDRQEGVCDQHRDEDRQRPHDVAGHQAERGRRVGARPEAGEAEASQAEGSMSLSIPVLRESTSRMKEETAMLTKMIAPAAVAVLAALLLPANVDAWGAAR